MATAKPSCSREGDGTSTGGRANPSSSRRRRVVARSPARGRSPRRRAHSDHLQPEVDKQRLTSRRVREAGEVRRQPAGTGSEIMYGDLEQIPSGQGQMAGSLLLATRRWLLWIVFPGGALLPSTTCRSRGLDSGAPPDTVRRWARPGDEFALPTTTTKTTPTPTKQVTPCASCDPTTTRVVNLVQYLGQPGGVRGRRNDESRSRRRQVRRIRDLLSRGRAPRTGRHLPSRLRSTRRAADLGFAWANRHGEAFGAPDRAASSCTARPTRSPPRPRVLAGLRTFTATLTLARRAAETLPRSWR